MIVIYYAFKVMIGNGNSKFSYFVVTAYFIVAKNLNR